MDHWHLIRLANDMVTEVRQRAARQRHGRRGRKIDPAWAHRRLLLAAGDRLSARGLDRLEHVLATDDPTGEIGAAWGCKERLRQLLSSPADPWVLRARLEAFYRACAAADTPETTRLAGPGIVAGVELDRDISALDLTPTMAKILDIPCHPVWRGRVVEELFVPQPAESTTIHLQRQVWRIEPDQVRPAA